MARTPVRDAVTIITGASAGIGAAAARAFAREGARVILAARDAPRLELLAEALRAEGLAAHAVAADVTRDEDLAALAEAAIARHGRIDILVANAGVGLWGRLEDLPMADHRRVFDVNYFGVVRSVQAVIPHMRRQGAGLIQIVSSVLGWRGIPEYGGYCATKFALRGLAETLRVELADSGITVQTVYPTLTDTGFAANAILRNPSDPSRRIRPMPARDVAEAMVRAARRGRRDTILSAGGRALAALNGLAPALVDRIVTRLFPAAGRKTARPGGGKDGDPSAGARPWRT